MGVGIQVWISRLYIPCVCVFYILHFIRRGSTGCNSIWLNSFFFSCGFFFFRTKTKLEMSDQMTRSILLSSRKPLSFFCCCFRLCVFVRQQIVNTEIEKSALCVCVYLSSVCVCGVYFSSGGERERSGKVTQLRYSGQTAFSCHILPFFSSHL